MENQQKQKRSKPLLMSLFVLLLLILVSGGLLLAYLKDRALWTNDAFIEGYSVDLSANVTERILALYCDEGDFVEEGQLIAELQNNIPLAQKAAAEARIKSYQEEIRVKEASFMKVHNDYVRAAEGIEDKVISAQDYDHSEKDLEIATAELELARANLELAKRELEVIEAELVHYMIYAPQDGVIAKRWVWGGDVITSGESLFTLYDLENVWVTANLEEYKMENIRLGDRVTIAVDAYPDYTFEGEIFTIKGAAASQFSLVPQNNATGNFTKVAQRIPIKITIKRPKNFPLDQPLYLFPGMSTEVRIHS